MLEQIREKNKMTIYRVEDKEFQSYGRIVEGYDWQELITYMEEKTSIPESGNQYIPSVPEMEAVEVARSISDSLYGQMPIQIGYCNGKNSTYNGFEYHKGSEINIAVTDFLLVLGHRWDISNKTYHVEDAKVFFVKKGTAIEMYQTTLHLSPCKVGDEGFKDIVILPKGTNTPLETEGSAKEEEDELLLLKNKWVIAHPHREPLIKQGAYPGVIGENIELYY